MNPKFRNFLFFFKHQFPLFGPKSDDEIEIKDLEEENMKILISFGIP